jgi:hypothetical protein
MSLKPKKSASAIPPLEANTYTGICIGVIDLGEQADTYNKNSKVTKYVPQLLLILEIAGETVEQDGEQKPRWLSKRLTNSLGKKSNLLKYSKALTGSELDADAFTAVELIGSAALIHVDVKENDESPGNYYNVIDEIIAMPKGYKAPAPGSELLVYDMDEPSDEVFGKLPEWIRDVITESPTYETIKAANSKPVKVDLSKLQPKKEPDKPLEVAQSKIVIPQGLPEVADF